MDAVIRYLEGIDPKTGEKAKNRKIDLLCHCNHENSFHKIHFFIFGYACFDHFDKSTESYSFATYFQIAPSCEKEAIRVLVNMAKASAKLKKQLGNDKIDELFAAEMNATVIKDSEE